MLPPCSVNHSMPFASNTAVCGSSAFSLGMGYCVILPVRGSIADIAAEIRCKPEIAAVVGKQSMRPGILSFNQRIFSELTGLRIQPAKLVQHLFTEPQ
jgi:hypothetical protein